MLADEVEAVSRANRPGSVEEIEALVDKRIRKRLDDGQLDDSDLTLQDLQEVRGTFVNVLQGIFHPRIKYPEDTLEEEGESSNSGDRAKRPDPSPVRGKSRSETSD
jgi:membrane-associated HD superfamily phosphohydrolase